VIFNLRSHRYLFFLVVFLIPLNLGKHFVFNWSYPHGLLIDYLVPTLFVTDLLIFILLVWWGLSLKKEDWQNILGLTSDWGIRFLIFFLFSLFLSVLAASSFYPALYAFVKIFLYIGFFVYVVMNFDPKYDFVRMVKVLSVSVFLLGILAGLQWSRQGSVFNNYLFFGEQPYSFSTYGVVRENFFGHTRIPAYGTFRHPNVFGGFLAIVLLWMLVRIPENRFVTLAFIPGVFALFFTVSISAWLLFSLGLLSVFLIKKFNGYGKISVIFAALIFISVFTLLPLFSSISSLNEEPSFYRRADFIVTGLELVRENILFGVGVNNITVVTNYSLFIQPIHNVYVLLFAESGVFAFLFFILFLVYAFKKALPYPLLLITLFQIVALAGIDHYFYTINQTQILFWLTLGVVFKYNLT
jgi:hypothetical protein